MTDMIRACSVAIGVPLLFLAAGFLIVRLLERRQRPADTGQQLVNAQFAEIVAHMDGE